MLHDEFVEINVRQSQTSNNMRSVALRMDSLHPAMLRRQEPMQSVSGKNVAGRRLPGLIIAGESIMSHVELTRLVRCAVVLLLLVAHTFAYGQETPKLGEVRFTADNQSERDSGVWIDGKYAGYVKELKGNRKVMLSPGEHEILIRQAGYKDFTKKIVVEPDQFQTIGVELEENPKLTYPGNNAAELRLDILPKRAAVFVDDNYMGHGSDFGGRFHSMLVTPGKHHLKVTLDGYRTYEAEIDALASNKSQTKIVLEKGSDPAPGQ